jgi:hypothetical protein
MSNWALLILVTLTWVLWAVGALQAHQIGKREGRRRPDSHMSVAPILPLFPLMAFGAAWLVDKALPPWGTRIVAISHAALAVGFILAIGWQTVSHRQNPAA